MFLLIPIGIFLISIAVIAWVVGRKFVYLKKLTPEVIDNVVPEQESFWVEFFPGPAAYFGKINVRQYRLNVLAEFEKFLRKLRLFFMKFDAVTNHLIHSVRKLVVHNEGLLSEEAAVQVEQEIKIIDSINANGKSRDKDWKEEEQRLILEIAKNPKEAVLYKKLGNIYVKTREWYDATESFKKAVELDPEDEGIKIKLERAIKKLEKLPA